MSLGVSFYNPHGPLILLLGSSSFEGSGRPGFLEGDMVRRLTCRAGIIVWAWENKCLFSTSVFSKSSFGTRGATGSYRSVERGYRAMLDSLPGKIGRGGMWERPGDSVSARAFLEGRRSDSYRHSEVGQRSHVLMHAQFENKQWYIPNLHVLVWLLSSLCAQGLIPGCHPPPTVAQRKGATTTTNTRRCLAPTSGVTLIWQHSSSDL